VLGASRQASSQKKVRRTPYIVEKHWCGPRVSLRSDNFHRARENKPGQVVCPSVTES
jgi:hypothetical protein